MKKEFILRRKKDFTIAMTKLITAIESLVFMALGLYLYAEVPAPGLTVWGKVIFLVVLVAALIYIAAKINLYFCNQKIDECNRKIDSILKFKNMSRQIDSYLEFAKWESLANGKK